ncbi:MAG TPA: hypothetical protein DDZ83_00465 [Nitrospinae bacterium]|nr:hypothetical protein [Nitrospinota bacterium]
MIFKETLFPHSLIQKRKSCHLFRSFPVAAISASCPIFIALVAGSPVKGAGFARRRKKNGV